MDPPQVSTGMDGKRLQTVLIFHVGKSPTRADAWHSQMQCHRDTKHRCVLQDVLQCAAGCAPKCSIHR